MKSLKLTLTHASLLAFVSTAFAQGSAFTWQGRLTDAGQPANGLYDLTFVLYDAASGGTALGTNTLPAAVVSKGLYTAALDFGAAVFDGNARWLEPGLRTNGAADYTTLVPRQALTPTPYAISAARLSGDLAASQISGTIPAENIGAGTITSSMLALGSVTSDHLAAGSVSSAALAGAAVDLDKMSTKLLRGVLATTLNDPTPQPMGRANAIAAVWPDKVMIGSASSSLAYLFSTNGTLLTTFTEPSQAGSYGFGISVAALGTDRVLIGDPWHRAPPGDDQVHLFGIDGTLLQTFTSPNPQGRGNFGDSVAAVGLDRVLIGAPFDDTFGPQAGAAYLFHTNGTLLATYAGFGPGGMSRQSFGWSVEALGTDKVLIGDPLADFGAVHSGVVWLFEAQSDDPTWPAWPLHMFASPAPKQYGFFGWAIAPTSTGNILVGGNSDAVYLLGQEGTLLSTFTNPAPTDLGWFGGNVIAMGSDKVVVGTFAGNSSGERSVACVFSTQGTLLLTLTNPVPRWPFRSDPFGPEPALAALGAGSLLVGDEGDGSSGPERVVYQWNLLSYLPGLLGDGVVPGSITAEGFAPDVGVWTKSGPSIFYRGGNVGVGTPTPQQPLDVAGRIRSSSGGFVFPDGTIQTTAAGGGLSGAGAMGQVSFWSGAAAISGNSQLFWDNANVRLGIGTPSPQFKLDVSGTVRATAFQGSGAGLTGISSTPVGSAGGSLTGTYPNPSIAAGAITDSHVSGTANISASKISGGDLTAARLKVGASHSLLASGATIAGGSGSTVESTATYATISGGAQAKALSYGQQAYANGAFATAGDAQASLFILRRTTPSAAETELFLDGSSQRVKVPAGANWAVDVTIVARTTGNKNVAYDVKGLIWNNAGTLDSAMSIPTLRGNTSNFSPASSADITVTHDSVNDALVIKVRSPYTTTSTRWVATVRTTEVTN